MEDPIPKPLIIYQTDFNINFIKMKKMKKIILSFLCVFALSFTYGQGSSSSSNLGFNQVINYDYNSTVTNQQRVSVGSLTVPNNKVWKITSGSAYHRYGGIYYTHWTSLFVDDNIVCSGSGGGTNGVNSNTPIWLSSGTYTVYLLCHNSNGNEMWGALSIVEFNVE